MTSANNSSTKSVTVDCSGSKIVLGGGADVSLSAQVTVEHFPVDSNTWQANGTEIDDGSPTTSSWTVSVYAICVNP